MKKVLSTIIIFMIACSACMSAEKLLSADSIKVEEIVGSVSYEVSNGEWSELKKGMLINNESNITTGLNSTLTILCDGNLVTIKPMKKGKLSDLITLSTSKSGVKIGSRITSEDLAIASGKSVAGGVVTSRASEAKADIEWDE